MSNPYTTRPVTGPAYFKKERGGRGALAHRLLVQLARDAPLPDAVALLGEKRVGKSSLLGFLQRALQERGLPAVRVNLLGLSAPTPEGFYAEVGQEMSRAG